MIKIYHTFIHVIFILFIILFANNSILCQKKYFITLMFPSSIKEKKLEIRVDDGKGTEAVKFKIKNHKLFLSDTFYSKFAAIEIFYMNEGDKFHAFKASFFVSSKPATIDFRKNNTASNAIAHYKYYNAIDMADEDAQKFEKFYAAEDKDFHKFYEANEQKLGVDDSITNIIQAKADIMLNKQTAFFKNCSGSYHCLWLFKNRAVYNPLISGDSLLGIYRNAFSPAMRNSFEGAEIEKIIYGKNTAIGRNAPNFAAKDINGQLITLNSFKNTYVLIDFWASWCGPCIKELPYIKKIRNEYPEEKLKIIFITQDQEMSAFSKAVSKNEINFGTHIFSTPDLINLYGAQAIPKTFLIDPNGVIIYNNQVAEDSFELPILNKLLTEKLK